MKENAALSRVMKLKDHSIPLGVRYWIFFKTVVLENSQVRKEVCARKTKLSLEEFRELMRPLLNRSPFRPSTRRTKASCDRLNRDMVRVIFEYYKVLLIRDLPWEVRSAGDDEGLGIFAKRKLEWNAECSKMLFGVVASVSQEDFDAISNGSDGGKTNYPSLFDSHVTGGGILFGPVSLLNHACDAELKLGNPTTRGTPELFEGFSCLRLKFPEKRSVVFERGQEICIQYGMTHKNFRCKCRKCMSRS